MNSSIACVFYSHINLKVLNPDAVKKKDQLITVSHLSEYLFFSLEQKTHHFLLDLQLKKIILKDPDLPKNKKEHLYHTQEPVNTL